MMLRFLLAAAGVACLAAGPVASSQTAPVPPLEDAVKPIRISGLGIREASLVLFLEPLGVPHAQSIALGLALYFLNLIASLLGAPAFALGGRRSGQKAFGGDEAELHPIEEAELAFEGAEGLTHLLEEAEHEQGDGSTATADGDPDSDTVPVR